MNILVTGGAGYIGSHTAYELVRAGYRPVIVDNFSNSDAGAVERLQKLTGQPITFYQADCGDTAMLAEIIEAEAIEGIVHFAAFKAVGESVAQPLKYYDNNVATFVALLHTAVAHNISRFVFSSTAAVYGNAPDLIATEETPCNPESPYGWSKRMDEVILRDTCQANPGLLGTALRYFNVVGAHESGVIGEMPKGRPQNLLPIIIQAVSGQIPPLTVYGTDYPTPDGTCLRDYIHVTDLAKAHVAALQRSGANYDVFNIGTGKPTSVLELIKTFEAVNNVSVPHTLGSRRPGDPVAMYAAANKALDQLGWQATKTIEDACRDAWRFYQNLTSKD